MTSDKLKTPTIALGTWAWGDSGETGDGYFGSSLTQAGLEEVADKAHAAGFTLWDTAIVYGMGRSETVLGKVLKRYARSDYQLSTKFNPRIAGTSDTPMADMLEQSLANLGTDYIDLYWIHNPADVRVDSAPYSVAEKREGQTCRRLESQSERNQACRPDPGRSRVPGRSRPEPL
jgi:aryl-alcohol dehydrogenase-like predicted oxidoreductase